MGLELAPLPRPPALPPLGYFLQQAGKAPTFWLRCLFLPSISQVKALVLKCQKPSYRPFSIPKEPVISFQE